VDDDLGGFGLEAAARGEPQQALLVAYAVVACELVMIAWVRRRFLSVPLSRSLAQVTMGGAIVVAVGVIVGSA
jgi:hypothetical protein